MKPRCRVSISDTQNPKPRLDVGTHPDIGYYFWTFDWISDTISKPRSHFVSNSATYKIELEWEKNKNNNNNRITRRHSTINKVSLLQFITLKFEAIMYCPL